MTINIQEHMLVPKHEIMTDSEIEDLKNKENLNSLREKLKSVNIEETAKTLDIGEMTLADIISELSKPGRDPREDMPKPVLRSDVLKFEDLTEGMVLTGTVRNVIDFGAFVDIGVKYDGLVHISEMSDSYVKSPSEIVSVGDIVAVIATDELIKDDWIDKANDYIAELNRGL